MKYTVPCFALEGYRFGRQGFIFCLLHAFCSQPESSWNIFSNWFGSTEPEKEHPGSPPCVKRNYKYAQEPDVERFPRQSTPNVRDPEAEFYGKSVHPEVEYYHGKSVHPSDLPPDVPSPRDANKPQYVHDLDSAWDAYQSIIEANRHRQYAANPYTGWYEMDPSYADGYLIHDPVQPIQGDYPAWMDGFDEELDSDLDIGRDLGEKQMQGMALFFIKFFLLYFNKFCSFFQCINDTC